MNINELISKRNAKIGEIKTLALTELNDESRSKIEAIKAEIESLGKDIATARYLAEIEEIEVKKEFQEERKVNEKYNLLKAIREFSTNSLSGLEKEMHEEGIKEFSRSGAGYTEGLIVPNLILSQRTDVLASNTANFTYSTLAPNLNVANTRLIMPFLGVTKYEGLEGNIDLPNMAELTANFVAEDAASTVVTVTDSKAQLTPRFIAANQVFSKQYLNQTSMQIQNQLLNQFVFAIDKGIEQELFNQLSGLTESSASLSAITWSNLVNLFSYVPYASAIIASRTQAAAMKTKAKESGAGLFVWDSNNTVAGIPAFESSLISSTHIYTGDFSSAAVGYWNGGLVILTDPFTNKSKGKIDIQVSRVADVKLANNSQFAKMVIG